MKPKAYIFAGLAVVCGLGASYMTSRLLAERTPDEPEKVEILVASRNLNFGERITKPEEMFELKPVLKENEPPDAIHDFEAVRGKMLKSTRLRGDHITPANLYDKDPLDIPEGHVAVGLPVSLQTTAHGLASLPGSRVDLFFSPRVNDAKAATARVLLQNVLILAADGRINREGEIIAPAQVVTFALTRKDAQRVTLAKEHGTLSLVLRKLNDASGGQGDVVTWDDVLNDKKPQPKAVEVAQAPQPKPVEVKPEPKPTVEPKIEDPKDIRTLTIINGANRADHQYEVLPDGGTRWNSNSPANGSPAPQPPSGVQRRDT